MWMWIFPELKTLCRITPNHIDAGQPMLFCDFDKMHTNRKNYFKNANAILKADQTWPKVGYEIRLIRGQMGIRPCFADHRSQVRREAFMFRSQLRKTSCPLLLALSTPWFWETSEQSWLCRGWFLQVHTHSNFQEFSRSDSTSFVHSGNALTNLKKFNNVALIFCQVPVAFVLGIPSVNFAVVYLKASSFLSFCFAGFATTHVSNMKTSNFSVCSNFIAIHAQNET